jgi:Mn2+/Fe2+ NRAMP family transporter
LNFLTIVTEFIGVSLSLSYLGVSKYVAVPIAAAALVAITVSGSFRFWERSMFMFVFANFLVIPLFILATPMWARQPRTSSCPASRGARPQPRCF